jgi:hypothetical protein
MIVRLFEVDLTARPALLPLVAGKFALEHFATLAKNRASMAEARVEALSSIEASLGEARRHTVAEVLDRRRYVSFPPAALCLGHPSPLHSLRCAGPVTPPLTRLSALSSQGKLPACLLLQLLGLLRCPLLPRDRPRSHLGQEGRRGARKGSGRHDCEPVPDVVRTGSQTRLVTGASGVPPCVVRRLSLKIAPDLCVENCTSIPAVIFR